MRIAHNPETGEYLGMQGGEWKPLRIAENDKGDRLFLGENGWEPLNTETAATPDKPAAADDDGLGRQFGLGVRGVLEGAGEIPQTFLNGPINGIAGLFGYDPDLRNPGAILSDAVGLPSPRTDAERLRSAIVRGGTGAVPLIKGGQAIKAVTEGATKAIPKLINKFGGFLADAPAAQIAGGAAGEGAAEKVRQTGGNAAAQAVAALAGGIGAPMALVAGQQGIRNAKAGVRALEALSDGGQKRIAAENIRNMATDPDAVLATLERETGEIVPGSKPTLGQLSGDSGIAVTEKGRASTSRDRALYGERYADQQAARDAELSELADSADARSADVARSLEDRARGITETSELERADIGDEMFRLNEESRAMAQNEGMPVADSGSVLRDIYGQRYAAAKAKTKAAYDSIDPDGTATFSLEPLQEQFLEVIPQGPFAPEMPGPIRRIMGQMDDAIQNGQVASYRDLQNVRTQLQTLADGAKSSGDANLNRIATGMKKRLDNWLDTIPDPGDAVMAKPGSKAYRAMEREARASVGPSSDPFGVDLQYMRKLGINKDWLVNNIGPHAPAELNKMYPGLVRESGTFVPDVSMGGLQTRFNTGDEIYDALKNYYPTYAGRSGAAGRALDEMLWVNRQTPTGFTDAQAEAFKRAKAMRSEQGGLYEDDFNLKMSRGQLRDDQIVGNYWKSGDAGDGAAKDFLRAFGDDETALATLSDHIVSEFRAASIKNGNMSADLMDKFLKKYSSALNNFPELKKALHQLAKNQRSLEGRLTAAQLRADAALKQVERERKAAAGVDKNRKQFLKRGADLKAKLGPAMLDDALAAELERSGAMNAQEIKRLRAVQKDVERRRNADKLASVRGSPTAQNLATQAIMDTALGRSLGRNRSGGLGSSIGEIGKNAATGLFTKAAELMYGRADENINRIIDQAFLDPEFAKELLKGYKPFTPRVSSADILKGKGKAAATQSVRSLLNMFTDR